MNGSFEGANVPMASMDGHQEDWEERVITMDTLPCGKLTSYIHRDSRELWFRAGISVSNSLECPSLSFQTTIDPAFLPEESEYFITRGWVELVQPGPPGLDVKVEVRLYRATATEPLKVIQVVDKDRREGKRFVELVPLQDRMCRITDAFRSGTFHVDYSVMLKNTGSPLEVNVLLSPQFMSEAEWQKEQAARKRDGMFRGLSDSPAADRLAQLYFDSAADYVQAYLRSTERVHCYMQADLVREWYTLIVGHYPEIDKMFRLTGIRRSPAWQSSNILTPRNGRTVQSYLDNRDGVVLDTWRMDGATETKVQTVPEFRRLLNRHFLEETAELKAEPER